LRKLTPEQVRDVENKINERSGKRFNFVTPLERFQQLTNINPVEFLT